MAIPKRRAYGKNHILLQFRTTPRGEILQELGRRGISVLDFVPENGLMVSANDYVSFDGLDLERIDRLGAEDKLSPLVTASPRVAEVEAFVVEFFRDVDASDMRELARENHLMPLEHAGLAPNHLLVFGTREAVKQLTHWDEVAYIFPASEELRRGRPVYRCGGAETLNGSVGQYTALMGDGWDGPGQGSATVGYYFGTMSSVLPRTDVQTEILRALGEWSKSVAVTFVPAYSPTQTQTIALLFGKRSHGDGYAFDGPGGVLAHTFYPSPPNSESIAGDMHFDDDESWHIGANIDLYSVALHEAGHALGLGHSDNPGSVMYPYYRMATTLTADDIAAVRQLYAPASETPTLPTTPTEPTTPTDPTTPATPAEPVAPTLAITSPTTAASYVSPEPSVTLAGTASHADGITQVVWINSRGGNGTANGTTSWMAGPLTLQEGQNLFTVTATATGGITTSRTIAVSYSAPVSGDTVAPTLTISSPASSNTATSATTAVISGTAKDNIGVVQVTWTDSTGNSGTASGTSYWKTSAIPLRVGANSITIRAYDAAGNSGWRSLMITRK